MNSQIQNALARVSGVKGELAWIGIGQGLAALAALVGVRILTELLAPNQYGELALAMTVALLINQSVFGPLTNAIARFYAPAAEVDEIGAYLRATRTLTLVALAVVAGISIVLAIALWSAGYARLIGIEVITLVFASLTGCNGILGSIQNASRQRSIAALHQGLEGWTRFGFAALLILCVGASSRNAMWGYTIGISIVFLSQCLFFRRLTSRPSAAAGSGKWRHDILRYSLPFYSWCLFTWSQLSSDRWAIAMYGGEREVGLYAVLFQLGNYPIAVVSAMTMQLLAPIFYARAGDGSSNSRNARVSQLGRRLTALSFGVTAVAVSAGFFLHARIFSIFVAKEYASISNLLPYVLLGSGIFAASQIIELSFMSQMKARKLISAKIITAILAVSLNFAGARWFGLEGVVFAGVAASVFYLLWMGSLVRGQISFKRSALGQLL